MFDILWFIALISIVVLFSKLHKTNARLEHIERYLQNLTKEAGARVGVVTSPVVDPLQSAYESMTSAPVLSTPASHMQSSTPLQSGQPWRDMSRTGTHEPDGMERFIAWVKEDWLMKLGGVLVILGMAWFVSYAIAEGWIGESGRIALGLMVGAGILALGRYRMMRVVPQGSILMVVGAAGIILTLFAARELYDMFTPGLVLLLMFGTSCLLGATSVVMRRHELAYANVLLAGLAPLLINQPSMPLMALFTYLMVLAVGSVWVAGVTGWRDLSFASLIIVGLYSMPYLSGWGWSQNELDPGLVFAYAFTALYFGVSIMGMRMARAVNVVDLLLALCSGIFLMAWIMVGVVEEWQSLILVAWTVVFAFGAFLAVRLGAGVAYFYSYAGVGVVLLGVATAIELDGPSLTIAATIETALVLWLGYRITGNVRAVPILALPSIIPILMSFESMGSYAWGSSYGCSEFMAKSSAPCTTSLYWYERLFHADAFVLFFITIVMTLLGCFFYVERVRLAEEARARVKTITTVLWSIAGVYTAILVWLVAHAIFVGDEGTTTALVVYAVAGSLFYMVGRANGKRWQRVIAGLLLGFVVLHLVFVEMVDMPVELKWITFFGIGALFMLVAWLARNRMHGAQKTSG